MDQSGVSGYEPFDRLIAGLKAEGFPMEAQRLHAVLHETAWTTSSELLGELGREIVSIRQANPSCSTELRRAFDDCMGVVRRVWPSLGR